MAVLIILKPTFKRRAIAYLERLLVVHSKLMPSCQVREGVPRKNCSSFGFRPNYLPPPLPPIWTTCIIFSDVEIQDLKVSLGLKILFILCLFLLYYFPPIAPRIQQKPGRREAEDRLPPGPSCPSSGSEYSLKQISHMSNIYM